MEAIAAYDEFLAQWGRTDEDGLHCLVAMVLVNRAIVLRRLGRFEDAIRSCNEVLDRFSRLSRSDVRKQVAKAPAIKGASLLRLDRPAEELAAYESFERFETALEPGHEKLQAFILYPRGHLLGSLDRQEEAIAVYDDVAARLRRSDGPEILSEVAGALVSKGLALSLIGRRMEAVGVYDDIVGRFSGCSEPDIAADVAAALAFKGNTLRDRGRSEEAIRRLR